MIKAKTLQTWAGNSEFKYFGSVDAGTVIPTYGYQRVIISASQYESLLDRFRGCIVDLVSFKPSRGSIGEWLMSNVTKTKIAPQVGAILIAEGYAAKSVNRGSKYFDCISSISIGLDCFLKWLKLLSGASYTRLISTIRHNRMQNQFTLH